MLCDIIKVRLSAVTPIGGGRKCSVREVKFFSEQVTPKLRSEEVGAKRMARTL